MDWEKAFDKVNHDKMFQALERLNIHADLIAAIRSLYEQPELRVKTGKMKVADTSKEPVLGKVVRSALTCSF